MAKKIEETVEKVESTELVTASSSLMADMSGDLTTFDDIDFGMEGLQMTLTQIPVIKLTQAMSPEVQDRAYPDIYAGMLIDGTTKDVLGEEVVVRIMRSWKQRTKFPPRDAGQQGIECACPTYGDPNDEGSKYGKCKTCIYNNFDTSDHCQTQYCFVVALENNPNALYRIILAKTSYKAGREFERSMQTLRQRHKGIPSFAFRIKIAAKEERSAKVGNTYYVYSMEPLPVKPGDVLIPAEIREELLEQFLEVKKLREESIEYHKRSVAASKIDKSGAIDVTASSFDQMGEEIEDALGLKTTAVEEEIPF